MKAHGLVASIAVLPEDRTIPQAVEDMTRRGTLFAVVITSQNEVHSSVTLNILHGQPQGELAYCCHFTGKFGGLAVAGIWNLTFVTGRN